MMKDPHKGTPVLAAGVSLERAEIAVVLLHGRGASAEDILGLADAFGLENAAYLAPQAAGGTWYPQSFLAPREANEPYLDSALGKVGAVVQGLERAGFGPERIVLAGFSQGACLSTEFVVSHAARYGGLIAFTGGLIGSPGGLPAYSGELAGMPALLMSGDPDPHVPWVRVAESAAILSGMGAQVTTKRIAGRPHTISQEEIRLARELLLQVARGVGPR